MEGVVIIADSKGKGYTFSRGIYEYIKDKKERDFDINMTDIEIKTFRDGEFKVRIKDNMRRRSCFFIHDSNKRPADWLAELLFTLEAMTFSSPEEINVILPYTRFARQDRKDESRVSVNAKVLADTVSLYATRGMTVDLHSPQIQEYFSIPFDNLYSVPALISHLQEKHPEILENLVIVSPDAGGGKRAESLVNRLAKKGINAEIAYGNKQRIGDNKVGKIVIIGDVKNKNCLIFDDIIDTGGTMIGAAEVLRKEGAKGVYAYGTHGLFSAGTAKFGIFDKVFTSDTLYTPEADNKEIVSVTSTFGEAIYRTVVGDSLSVLFDGRD